MIFQKNLENDKLQQVIMKSPNKGRGCSYDTEYDTVRNKQQWKDLACEIEGVLQP